MAANLTTHRNGTIADGISNLVLIVESKTSLQFSINDPKHDNSNGTLSSLEQASNVNNNSFFTAKGSPHNISNGKSVVAVVYIPPDSFNQDKVIGLLNMSQIQINLLGHFLKFQYISIVLPYIPSFCKN